MEMHKEYPEDSVESKIVTVIKTCYDPEIPVDIYALGLIYDVAVDEDKTALVTMTLSSPACPVAGTLPPEIQQKISQSQSTQNSLGQTQAGQRSAGVIKLKKDNSFYKTVWKRK